MSFFKGGSEDIIYFRIMIVKIIKIFRIKVFSIGVDIVLGFSYFIVVGKVGIFF